MKKQDIIDVLSMTNTPMDLYQITNEFELLDMIDTIERYFRSSREYKAWVTYKKFKHKQTICRHFKIDTRDYDKVRIEQDHYPISLFDICWIVGLKMLSDLEDGRILTTYQIVDQVMREHLVDQTIATVSLTTTVHQMRHENLYNPENEDINGDYKTFLKKYEPFVPQVVLDRINAKIETE